MAESSTIRDRNAGPVTGTEQALTEILAQVVGAEQVSVEDHFFDDLGADSMLMARFCARVRKQAVLPSVSIKDVYQHPTIKRLAAALANVTTSTPAAVESTEQVLAAILAKVVGAEQVPVDSHFFDDLGADSMLMARFCARVRKQTDLPSVSIKDVYQHPTIRSLAAALRPLSSTPVEPAAEPVPAPVEVEPASTRQYVLCGALQFLIFLCYSVLTVLILAAAFQWIAESSAVSDIYLRAVLTGAAYFVGACTFPILAKWVLIGRWKPQQIPIWSLSYLRFWVVKALIQANPLVLFFNGSPLYTAYLRALGAKIGRNVLILSKRVPVCTDLLTIGDGTVIRKDSFFNCYRAHSGVIQTGAVTIGKNVLVGEAAVLDIETSLGDGAQLGHASSLHTGQVVPDGERWHGSPAERTDVNYQAVESTGSGGTLRKALYTVMQLLKVLGLYLPLVLGGAVMLFTAIPWLDALDATGTTVMDPSLYTDALVSSSLIYFGGLLVALLIVGTVPRVLNLFLSPDKVYPLYGFHYAVHRTISRMTNHKFFTGLFGDSSFIVHYLRWIGYRLSPVVQTGSNFGNQIKHEIPYLVSVGSGTVCASELSIANADYSSTSFQVSRARIGANNFLGNMIAYPSQSKTGDNCLLGTKVLVPIDGKVRENVGLLGSPSFEIPRTVERDNQFIQMASGDEYPRRLAAKNKYNLATIGLRLLGRWSYVFGLVVLYAGLSDVRDTVGALPAAVASALLILPFTLFHAVLMERASTGFRGLRPTYCSIYQIDFWRVERFFKNTADAQVVLNGTPFKSIIWRLLGVRLGKRFYDDGCLLAEKNMVTIGDDVTMNAGTHIQCHTQEDYAFKSDRITVGSGCTIGVGTMVYYGAVMGDGAVLAPDSFLMKGEEVAPGTRWGGNPAREMPETLPRFAHSPGHQQDRNNNDNVGAALVGAN